jgi:hypothetical protein
MAGNTSMIRFCPVCPSERSRWRGGRYRVHRCKRILRLKEEEWLRTVTGVNARSNVLTNVNNKLFRATPLFAMTSGLN